MTITMLIILIYLVIGYYIANKEIDKVEKILATESQYEYHFDFIENYYTMMLFCRIKKESTFNMLLIVLLSVTWFPIWLSLKLKP